MTSSEFPEWEALAREDAALRNYQPHCKHEQVLQAVLRLHSIKESEGRFVCNDCGIEAPCPTVMTIYNTFKELLDAEKEVHRLES